MSDKQIQEATGSPVGEPECTCSPRLGPNVSDARCPIHGVRAFFLSLATDDDEAA